eukprot:SAG11_NODE_2351_length_3481_cov_3.345062_1_plen_116_part_00
MSTPLNVTPQQHYWWRGGSATRERKVAREKGGQGERQIEEENETFGEKIREGGEEERTRAPYVYRLENALMWQDLHFDDLATPTCILTSNKSMGCGCGEGQLLTFARGHLLSSGN